MFLQQAGLSLPLTHSIADNCRQHTHTPAFPSSQHTKDNHIPVGSEQMVDSMVTSPPKAIGRSV